MRAVVQRVREASVSVEGRRIGAIDAGLLVYLGVSKDDTSDDVRILADKVGGMRILPDQAGVMNLSVANVGGEVLVVPAFTTQGDARRGRRPTYEAAAPPEQAEPLYVEFCKGLSNAGLRVERGRFRADMKVASINDGPVCILLDSKKAF